MRKNKDCGHSLCNFCMSNIIDKRNDGDDTDDDDDDEDNIQQTTVVCPMCRVEHVATLHRDYTPRYKTLKSIGICLFISNVLLTSLYVDVYLLSKLIYEYFKGFHIVLGLYAGLSAYGPFVAIKTGGNILKNILQRNVIYTMMLCNMFGSITSSIIIMCPHINNSILQIVICKVISTVIGISIVYGLKYIIHKYPQFRPPKIVKYNPHISSFTINNKLHNIEHHKIE